MTLSRQIFKTIRAFYRDNSPTQLALGLVVGFWLAGTPLFTLHGLLLLALLFVIRVNFTFLGASYLFFFAIFSLSVPLTDALGRFILLKSPYVKPYLVYLFHAPIFPFTRFYNSVVMGNFIICLAITPLLFFATRTTLEKNYARLYQTAKDSLLWKQWISSRLYRRNTR